LLPIVHGTKIARRRRGYVADFCPLCCDIRPFHVRTIRQHNHVYWLAYGDGVIVGHERACVSCGTTVFLDSLPYPALARRSGQDIEALIAETFPRVREAYAPRLDLEGRVASNTLTPDERLSLIAEPLIAAEYGVLLRGKSMHLDIRTTTALLSAMIAVALVIYVFATGPSRAERIANPGWTVREIGSLALLGFTILMLVVAALGDVRRFVSQHIVPRVARALAPLSPTEAELATVLAALRQGGLRVARYTRPHTLASAIEEAQATGGGVRGRG
jgi:hypothetical protein